MFAAIYVVLSIAFIADVLRQPSSALSGVGKAPDPRATAASVSSTPACTTSAIGSSVAGLTTVSATF